ncbi:MAG: transporter substrate-binding domain-containing protein [Bacteroidaceae bacterium]
MKAKTKHYLSYLAIAMIIATIIILLIRKDIIKGHPRDYAEIEASGTIRVVTEYNSLSYFADGDSILGFHYELIQAFAKAKGLKVDIIPEMSFEKRMKGLNNGTFDLIGYNLPVTTELKDDILLTTPIVLNKQILVQRKPSDKDSLFISTQLDLARRTLHVIKGSPSILRIHNLANEIGDTIYIKEVEKYAAEQLMAMVAHADIDYAVCDESLAKACIRSFPNLDISTDISFTQFYSWGVSKQSPVLLDSINSWLNIFKQTKDYQRIYRRYYKD